MIAETTARIEKKIADDNTRREAEALAKKNRSRRIVRKTTKIIYPKKREEKPKAIKKKPAPSRKLIQ